MKKSNYPSLKLGYYGVGIMTLAQVFAFIDRQIPAMLIEPIKADFGLSDSQIALLGGAAFSVFYAVMALPIGYAVDRVNRTFILGSGILVWSFMTALSGLADSFLKLFGARVGVAVGEAVMAPTSVSLVSDYFPVNKNLKNIKINFSTNINRSLEYYSGMVFNITVAKKGKKNVLLSGGRYDGLLKNLGSKKNINAVGAAIDMSML